VPSAAGSVPFIPGPTAGMVPLAGMAGGMGFVPLTGIMGPPHGGAGSDEPEAIAPLGAAEPDIMGGPGGATPLAADGAPVPIMGPGASMLPVVAAEADAAVLELAAVAEAAVAVMLMPDV
jgi:hypothetical protein